jgi:malyl-CoA/(S)-citramalyl-CoA lyase
LSRDRRFRAYLAVPAHRANMVEKAAASGADAVFMDLEDAVPVGEKQAALAGAADALVRLDWGAKNVSVRLNTVDAPTFADEVATLCGLARLDAVILPKAESVVDIAAAADRIQAARQTRNAPVEIELLIETARGLMNVDALANADALVKGLHLGVGDLAASLGARSADVGASPAGYRHRGPTAAGDIEVPLDLFAYPMMRVLVAARAFGLRAIDGPCGAFSDDVATAATATKAAAMGFDGKQVIHPRQIEPTRLAFTPTPAEIAYAQKVEAALEEAKRQGLGAVTVDGRMIDEANLRLIRRLLI